MKIKTVFLLGLMYLLLPVNASAQKTAAFKKLGTDEKLWVVLHPFSARKAYEISLEVQELCNRMKASNHLDADISGGKLDAFRHSYWMALLSKHIGPKRARWLGRSHERKNRRDFEQKRIEDAHIPDKISILMDLYNNDVGIQVGKEHEELSDQELKELIFKYIADGKMLIVRKDRNGNSLDASGEIILSEDWEGKWENERVLVPSDYTP